MSTPPVHEPEAIARAGGLQRARALRRVRALVRWLDERSGLAHVRRVAGAGGDPWRRFELEPPLRAFGPGAGDFREYLARPCRIARSTPLAIAEWLLECRYAEDPQLLDEPDLWLHPVTFELLRCGDCEDFALWAWRQLVDARFDATFVVGIRSIPGTIRGRHAWVTYRDVGGEHVLDGVERTVERMIRPVTEVRAHYEPQVGVNAEARRFVYAGLYREAWGRALRLRPSRGSHGG